MLTRRKSVQHPVKSKGITRRKIKGGPKPVQGGMTSKRKDPTPMMVRNDDELRQALKDDAVIFFKAVDTEDHKEVLAKLRSAQKNRLRSFAHPDTANTVYMVSNRLEYVRKDLHQRVGIREVRIHTGSRRLQVGTQNLDRVPLGNNENVLLFVHGYNNSTFDAALSAWEIGGNLPGVDNIVFFSWPSKASTFAYFDDYETANKSIDALVECMRGLSENRHGKVHIVAHSMGCRLLIDALISYRKVPGRVRLGQVYFIAGDVGQDVFLPAMRWIKCVATKLSNISSNTDLALVVSKKIHGLQDLFSSAGDRAGLYPPVTEDPSPQPSFASLLKRETLSGSFTGHDYFGDQDIRMDISNQIRMYHSNGEIPENLRTSYSRRHGTQNAVYLPN